MEVKYKVRERKGDTEFVLYDGSDLIICYINNDGNGWQAKENPTSHITDVPKNAPTAELPDDCFPSFISEIQNYHRTAMGQGLEGYEEPEARKLEERLEDLEKGIIKMLEAKNPESLKNGLGRYKKLRLSEN